jgi:quinohemoprotein ethanol dehydrogenase
MSNKIMLVGLSLCLGLLSGVTLAADEGDDWTQNGRTPMAEYYSPLTSIDTRNVHSLGLAWEFDDFVVRGGIHRGTEATPLVVDGIMYFTGPWSVVYAVDATTGHSLWRYDPQVPGEVGRRACCDAVNRGVAIEGGVVYVGTLDGYLAAVDAKTGKPLWKVDTLIDHSRSYTITGAPRVAGSVVLIGNSGAEMGVRGYVSAYDLHTGKLAWRFFCVPGAPTGEVETPEMVRRTQNVESKQPLGSGRRWHAVGFHRLRSGHPPGVCRYRQRHATSGLDSQPGRRQQSIPLLHRRPGCGHRAHEMVLPNDPRG